MSLLGGLGGTSGNGLLGSLTGMAATADGYKGVPDTGTGVKQVVAWAKKNNVLTKDTLNAVIPELPGVFGGYPQDQGIEIGPDALFLACFAILMLANFGIFTRNAMRKHNFPLQIGLTFFCALKVIGFACRIAWAKRVYNIPLGISSLVFIQVAQLLLQSQNLVLAHRVFTWYHPQTGLRWFIVWPINFIYLIMLAIIAMAIIGQALPYLYFMSHHHHNICRNVMKAAAILNLVYGTLPFLFLLLAYAIPVGSVVKLPKVFNRYTQQTEVIMPAVYQASWVKSAHLFYYPEHNAQLQVYRGEPLDGAIRIIPSREPPKVQHRRINENEVMHPHSPRLHWAVVTVVVSSFVLVLNTCFRVAACFRNGPYAVLEGTDHWKVNFWPHHPYVMYIFYGATEVAILAFYLLMRIDLRFYIPDTVRGSWKGNADPEQPLSREDNPVSWAGAELEKETDSHDRESHDRDSPSF